MLFLGGRLSHFFGNLAAALYSYLSPCQNNVRNYDSYELTPNDRLPKSCFALLGDFSAVAFNVTLSDLDLDLCKCHQNVLE